MTYRYQRLADVAQLRRGRQSEPPGVHSADDGVLDGNDACLGVAFLDGADGGRERRKWDLLDWMPPDLRDGRLGVSAAVALERDAHHHAARVRPAAVRSRFSRP